ncbi:MAG: hypothetical protein D3926_13285 [Desulfobacteraceae bacterium]|nr:MAG: hypothetical protein D3926_13285 [Desulfobacteraceae bacterium]
MILGNLDKLGDPASSLYNWAVIGDSGYICLGIPVSMGAQAVLYYQIIHGAAFSVSECFEQVKRHFSALVIASVIYALIFICGLMVFILPGLYMAARLSFYPFYIMYENLPPMQALKQSMVVTRSYFTEVVLPVMGISFVILAVSYISPTLFPVPGFDGFAGLVLIDLAMAWIGWVTLIIPFRIYCRMRSRSASS